MRRSYSGPTLTRFGSFGELTLRGGTPGGKTALGLDSNPGLGIEGLCNPNASENSVENDGCGDGGLS